MLYGSLYGRETGGPTPPDSPEPVLVAWDATGAGPIVVGSWSESVTVTVEGVDETGAPAPTATVSGSGAGPYSMSIASGLVPGKAYGYTLTGLASSGSSVVSVALAVRLAPLTAPTPPAQGPPSAQGTTSVSVTWTHPDAPASGITYTLIATDLSDGSAVTPSSGSGLGPYVLPMTDGRQVICTLVVTRTADSQSVPSATYLASVEAAVVGAGWSTPLDLDLTGLTSAVLADDTTTVVTRAAGGATVATVWASEVTNSGTVTAGATGLVIDGVDATGSVTALIDAYTMAGLTPAKVAAGVAVDIYLTTLGDWNTASSAWRAGITTSQARFSVATENSVQGRYDSVGLQDRRAMTNDTAASPEWASNEAIPVGAWVVTMLVVADTVFAFYGTSAPSDAALTALTGAVRLSGTVAADMSDPVDSGRFASALFAGAASQLRPSFTWTRLRVRTRNT